MANILTRRYILIRTINCTFREKCVASNRHYFNFNTNAVQQNSVLKKYILPTCGRPTINLQDNLLRWYSQKKVMPLDNEKPKEKKESLFQRFKQMYRDYWYVLVPVHLITSAAWFGGFYYMVKSGIDVISILETMHISETITTSMKDSSMGYIAISYALYKIATPLRYTVTLGGTTISIKYLKELGYIKPVPTAQQLKNMYQVRKTDVLDAVRGKKVEIEQQQKKLKDKKDNIMKDISQRMTNVKTVKK